MEHEIGCLWSDALCEAYACMKIFFHLKFCILINDNVTLVIQSSNNLDLCNNSKLVFWVFMHPGTM